MSKGAYTKSQISYPQEIPTKPYVDTKIQSLDSVTTTDDLITFGGIDGTSVHKSGAKLSKLYPTITKISRSGYNAIGILAEGKVYTTCGTSATWSSNTTGRGMAGTTPFVGMDNFKVVPIYEPIIDIGGFIHEFAYALAASGNLYGWGMNMTGALGLNHTTQVPIPVVIATNVTKVFYHSSQGNYTVASNRLMIMKTDGKLYGSGYNVDGGLGIGTSVSISVFTEVKKTGGVSFTANEIVKCFPIGGYGGYTFVQTNDGKIWATGYNPGGQLGNGTVTNLNYFTDLTTQWTGVSSGVELVKVTGASIYYNTTAVLSATVMIHYKIGSMSYVKTCGVNTAGQIGNGTLTNVTSPFLVYSGTNVKDISTFGCPTTHHLLLTDGSLYGWGHNPSNQTGIGNTTNGISTKTLILNNVDSLLCDGLGCETYSYNTPCFVKMINGTVMSWGLTDNGYTGTGITTSPLLTITRVLIPIGFKLLGSFATANGSPSFVDVMDDNTMYAWGHNGNSGIASSSTMSYVATPVQFKLQSA